MLQKHVKSFIYAINVNENGYNALFFLTEKIYEQIWTRKVLIWGNLIFKYFFSAKNLNVEIKTSILKYFIAEAEISNVIILLLAKSIGVDFFLRSKSNPARWAIWHCEKLSTRFKMATTVRTRHPAQKRQSQLIVP